MRSAHQNRRELRRLKWFVVGTSLVIFAAAFGASLNASPALAGGGPEPQPRSESISQPDATPTPPDPGARLPEGDSASEYWDVVGVLETGHRVFARFLVTNVGPGRRTAVAVGHVVTPDGRRHEFSSARREGSWKLLEAGRMLDIGASHLDLRASAQALDIHKPDFNVRLTFNLTGGGHAPTSLLPAGYHVDRLGVDLRAEARIQLAGMSAAAITPARVALTHTWCETSEADLALRRTEVFALESGRALQISAFLPPVGGRKTWIDVTDGQGGVTQVNSRFSPDPQRLMLTRKGYEVAESFRMEGDSLIGKISLHKLILEHDPLGDLPQPFRWLVARTMNPHRVWAESVIDVTLPPRPKQTPLQFSGTAVTVVTFLNPIEKP